MKSESTEKRDRLAQRNASKVLHSRWLHASTYWPEGLEENNKDILHFVFKNKRGGKTRKEKLKAKEEEGDEEEVNEAATQAPEGI